MNCPYCNRRIEAMTGLQELQKFQKHLNKCKKSPHSQIVVDEDGDFKIKENAVDMGKALEIRHNSGQ